MVNTIQVGDLQQFLTQDSSTICTSSSDFDSPDQSQLVSISSAFPGSLPRLQSPHLTRTTPRPPLPEKKKPQTTIHRPIPPAPSSKHLSRRSVDRVPALAAELAMGGGGGEEEGTAPVTTTPSDAALHVIVLGSGGGPFESNASSFLVRSVPAKWDTGSVFAVDAGVHMAAIQRILEKTQPPDLSTAKAPFPHVLTSGPFKGLELRHRSAEANASDFHRSCVQGYLITHPHLDHISGMVINSANVVPENPKRIVGLNRTIDSLIKHIFNDIVWPNLTDLNGGPGLVTFTRLSEGGSSGYGAVDSRESKGYVGITNDLAVKAWCVSHGHCMKSTKEHLHRGSGSTAPSRMPSFDASSMPLPLPVPGGSVASIMSQSPRGPLMRQNSASPGMGAFGNVMTSAQQQHQHQQHSRELHERLGSGVPSAFNSSPLGAKNCDQCNCEECVYESSAFFIQDKKTKREILMFGDVEPDSVSLSPRNATIWTDAAPKIAAGRLAAIFIECSFDDSVPKENLFGHMQPRYIAEEMKYLAWAVVDAKQVAAARGGERDGAAAIERSPSGYASGGEMKRKRDHNFLFDDRPRKTAVTPRSISPGATSTPPKPTTTANRKVSGPEEPLSPRSLHPESSSGHHQHFNHPSSGAIGQVLDDGNRMLLDSQQPHINSSPQLSSPTAELSLNDAERRMTGMSSSSSMPPAGSGTSGAPQYPRSTTSHIQAPITTAASSSSPSTQATNRASASGTRTSTTTTTPTPTPTPTTGDTPMIGFDHTAPMVQGSLKGLKVVLIHIKDNVGDGPDTGTTILEELQAYEARDKLGVEYIIAQPGLDLYF